ncbi:MAG: pyruvate kinase [Verrucomicrobiia bacterium Tous-C2TDCM]|nr:MAG: pyruvate kinase [Verrucomicrobiae bacterium Tous-C2TDCM]
MSPRKTKLICTLGPATSSPEVVRSLIEAGAAIFRLNMSHATHDWVREMVGTIRTESLSLDAEVATLVDLQGPSIRTGDVEGKVALRKGDLVEFRNADLAPGAALSVTTNYDGLHGDLSEGDLMLVDNGELHFRVQRIEPGRVLGEVLTEGAMGSRRHINLPGILVHLPVLTEKDERDIALAADIDADFVAISFVRDAAHVALLREKLRALGCGASVVAKIEDQEAVKHLAEIVTEADAVMVARGDLGIEVHLEELPVVQRRIVAECARIGRKVIVATHLLESMVENPVPTRAEVTDVANAVFEQADAIMLSGETSVGRYPVKCVETLDRIARRIERETVPESSETLELKSEKEQLVRSAVLLAQSLERASLLVFTARGVLANLAANLRPGRAPIFAFSPDAAVVRSLVMNRAVLPVRFDLDDDPAENTRRALAYLREKGLVEAGDPVVIVSDVLLPGFDNGAVLLRHG